MAESSANGNENSNPNGTVQTQGGDQQVQANQEQAAPAQGRWGMVKSFAVRMFIIYLISSFFRRGQQPAQQTTDGVTILPAQNIMEKNALLDLYVYLSESETFISFDDQDKLFWSKMGVRYGDWESGPNRDGSDVMYGQITASPSLQNNGSMYIHVYLVPEGASPDPEHKTRHFKTMTIHKFKRLNKFKKRKFHRSVNLLTGQTDVHPDLIRKNESVTYEVLSHWHPNLTINLLDDHTPWIKGQIPQPLDEYLEFTPDNKNYYPVVYFNDYWNLNSEFMPINETTETLNLTLTFGPLSLFRWQMYAAQGMRNKWMSVLGDMGDNTDDDDQDTLKTTILETNPYLLAITIVVSIIHSVFEFLAFKNDIQFWRSRKSLEGLSVRSVFFNVFQSLIVVLYVLDHETNFVVKISVCVGLLIELWKIFKVIDVKLDFERRWFGLIPAVVIKDKSTYTQSDTKKYDMIAFKYLSWALFPLLGAYAVYSLLYMEHKGWYSWVLSMLYGFLLTFGFIMMTPQLFINYKLKSVAHLPWRMLTYKFLNTFIDDIFAFVIKMPTLYRIGCFRDDIVFLIYVYQRYVYRVDPKRVNEFGVSQEMLEKTPDGNAIANDPAVTAAIEAGSDTQTDEQHVDSDREEDVDGDESVGVKEVGEKKND